MMRVNQVKRIFLWGVLICVLTTGIAVAGVYLMGANDASGDHRVAVVYGNKVNEDGSLSPRLRARLDAAYAVYEQRIVETIIVSGAVGREGHDEAIAMQRYLQRKGVPAKAIIADSEGFTSANTSRNAYNRLGGEVPVVAVTQRYHLFRAKMSLCHAGFSDVQGYAPAYYEWRDIYAYLREIPALILYAVGRK